MKTLSSTRCKLTGNKYILFTIPIASLFNLTVCDVDICSVPTYRSTLYDTITLKTCLQRDKHATLVLYLQEWSFAETQVLRELPVDPVKRNFVRRNVQGAVFSLVAPTPFKGTVKLAIHSKDVLENILTMHESIVKDQQFVDFVSGSYALPGSTPLSHRYGGHQFGYWAQQLGDGRAHLLGEYINPETGERWELQLKGSGKTPYSRDGDGRAVIRSSVREFLASEAMYYLGISTSRAATLVVSDDMVWRDQFYQGRPKKERTAVVLRLAPSWFRIGSFEILARSGELKLLRQLADFVIGNYFSEIDMDDPNRYLAFFSDVLEKTAKMIAQWQGVGFVHGVCNTDNFSILSLTIDYGPFGFMAEYDPDMVPNTSDDDSRYSYRKQPDVGYFNINKLKETLLPLLDTQQQAVMDQILAGYKGIYERSYMRVFRSKLGLVGNGGEDDESIVALLLTMMKETKSDFTLSFRQLGDWTLTAIRDNVIDNKLWAVRRLSDHEWFDHWRKLYYERLQKSSVNDLKRKNLMDRSNPRYVLRNWMAEEAIRSTEKDDFMVLHRLHRVLKKPYEISEEGELAGYADSPPSWARHLRVSCSS